MTINGKIYQYINMNILYSVSLSNQKSLQSLIDRGANGGIAGNDVRIINRSPHCKVNIRGIDNHEITSVPIVTAGGVSESQNAPVLLIFHQYAYHPHHASIHSSAQLESYGSKVNDKSICVPDGLQCLCTPDGHILPLDIYSGLPYLKL